MTKAFFKQLTRIQDDTELKEHIIAVQTKAFAIYPYPCIRAFNSTRLKLACLPAYEQLLKLVGNDIRKAVQDGYPVQNTLASDLQKGLWDLGHELFRSTPETFSTHFIEGSPVLLECVPPFTKSSQLSAAPPTLSKVKTLNELHEHVSVLYVGAFFHLFNEQQQEGIARALAGLLSPEPGSVIIGAQGGSSKKVGRSCGKVYLGNIEVKAQLRHELGGDDYFGMWPGNQDPMRILEWSVTRL
ncbi:hypothetical protein GYMLUDRAFT_72806 [Collybiopsis luxurians FD-317 M1]|uniref:Uncharacterized protein n=1 Tax=Collybiopsis luxurians FD-317 M1 TaxID=944289 RepID=A0A0D0D0S0_9AGAR|nr:hypothetical protein GYMLUDRAFT_72806 [Collybiopsis luxurians FD-317 M1]